MEERRVAEANIFTILILLPKPVVFRPTANVLVFRPRTYFLKQGETSAGRMSDALVDNLLCMKNNGNLRQFPNI
jgi:hypothetical protein